MRNSKRWLLPLVMVFFGLTSGAFAQSSAYTFSTSSGTFDTLVGGTNTPDVEADTDVSNPIDIGFDFVYNGVTYDTVVASSNGFLSFNENSGSNTANNLDGVGANSSPLVAPLWDDLDGNATGGSYASYLTEGTAPNRVFTFEWKNWEWRWNSNSPVVTFQVKLYETTNVIEFHYRDEGNAPTTPTASIGIADVNSFLSVAGTANPMVSSTVEANDVDSVPSTGTVYTFTPPSCLAPSAVVASNITTTGARINWTSNASGTQWAYINVVSGTTPSGAGTLASADSVDLTSLSPATSYDFYVREICGANDTSGWVGPLTYTTACNAYSVPFSESFEGMASVGSGIVPTCWAATGDWVTADAPGTRSRDARTGSNYIYTDWSANDQLYTPTVTLSAGVSYDFSFYYQNDGNGTWDSINVFYGTSPDISLMTQLGSPILNPSNTTYTQSLSTFTPASAGNYYFAVSVHAGSSPWYMVFDDFSVAETPNCIAPTNVTVEAVGSDTAKLTWDFAGAGTDFAYINVVAGTAPTGQGTVITADSVTISSLTANTAYDFYVREICAVGDSSDWVGPITYTTLCSAFTVPFSESFEGMTSVGTGIVPDCWAETGDWVTADAPGTRARDARTGSNYIYTNWSANDQLYTPAVTLSAGVSYDFSFYYQNDGTATWDSINVFYGTSPDISLMTQLGSPIINPLNTTYMQSLSTFVPASAGDYYFAVSVHADGSPWYMVFDDFSVVESPNCIAPTNVVVESVGSDTAKLTWDFAGAGTEFAYINVAAGTTPTGQGTVITADSVIISSLSADTDYDFYVREICAVGDSSDWVGPITYATLCNVFTAPFSENFDGSDWTAGSGFNNAGDQISSCWNRNPATNSNFFWGTRTGTTNSTSTGPDSDNTSGSENYIYVEASNGSNGDVASIETPVIDLSGLTNAYLRFAYHMYGGDIQTLYIYADQGGVVTVIDSIVGEQQSGNSDGWLYKMIDVNAFTSADTKFGWSTIKAGFNGDVAIDDVEVFNLAPNDVGVTAFITPASFCGDTNTELTVVIENFGGASQTGFDITVDWTGSTTGSVSTVYNGTLASGQVDTVIVDTVNTILGGTFNLAGYTGLVGDANTTNDTTLAPGVIFFALPVVDLGVDQSYCVGNAFNTTLDAGNAGSTYLWNDGSTAQTLMVDTAGTYYVEVTTANGCIGTDTVIVTEDDVMVDLGADVSYCAGSAFSTTLDAGNAGSTYLWNDGSTAQTLVVDTAGTYAVTVTNMNGCIDSDTVIVTEDMLPVVTLGDSSVCDGETLTLDAGSGFATYAWSNGATTQTIDVMMAGTYTVTVSNAAGCTALDSSVVTVSTVAVSIPDFTGCEGSTVEIDAGSGFTSYVWSTGETSQSIQVTSSDDYSVTVTNADGCTGADTSTVVLSPVPVVDLGADTALANGETITLDAGNPGATYDWSTGASTQTIIVSYNDVPATISVDVTIGSCTATDEIEITKSVGLESVVRGGVSTYPNPVDNEFHIAFTAINGGNVSIEVYDVSGQLVTVSNNEINSGREDLVVDMSAYRSGVYIVKATLNNQVIGQFRAVKR